METERISRCYFEWEENNIELSKYTLKKYQNMDSLKDSEIKILENNGCSADSWDEVKVARPFDAALVRNTSFHGKVGIGRLEKGYIDYHGIKYILGIYNCDITDAVIDDYPAFSKVFIYDAIIGNYVIIQDCGEIITSRRLPFFDKDHNCLNLINEKGGRAVYLFPSITMEEIWLYANFRDRDELHKRLEHFMNLKKPDEPYNYTVIGNHCVLKNIKSIENVKLGRHVIIDGATRVKNSFVTSNAQKQSCIRDNVILTNSVCNGGVLLESGAMADRCFLDTGVVLKQYARVTECAVGCCSTIACGEVLNSMIFPLHQQHHNSSFLIAANIGGQSNIASGATIGSNHNSRANDGELIARRGFWPGLCTSVKHNSVFPSFSLLAKSDFLYEMNIPFPFSLISNNQVENALMVLPAYWWQFNMYALFRNQMKFKKRLGTVDSSVECDFMAPDTAEEILRSLELLKKSHGEIPAGMVENSERKVYIKFWNKGIQAYNDMLIFYCARVILGFLRNAEKPEFVMNANLCVPSDSVWHNAGGHLIPDSSVMEMIKDIESGNIISWDEVEDRFIRFDMEYNGKRLNHALEVLGIVYGAKIFSEKVLKRLKEDYGRISQDIIKKARESREKDFDNCFKMSVYSNKEEAEAVLGNIEDDPVLNELGTELDKI